MAVLVPQGVQQLPAGHGTAFVLHQQVEQLVFQRRQGHRFPLAGNVLPGRVQPDAAAAEPRFPVGPAAPPQGQQPGVEDLPVKGLGHIIVGAAGKPRKNIPGVVPHRQHQKGQAGAVLPQFPAKVRPGSVGQIPVQHSHIGQGGFQQFPRPGKGGAYGDPAAFFGQKGFQCPGNGGIVFHKQNVHRYSSPGGFWFQYSGFGPAGQMEFLLMAGRWFKFGCT